ncbi:MAG: hypothetical protein K2X47_08245 [Bdellovibrionales bacterium]|nr:hypothetical protein [Bdellovibrionales bacterium]
MSRFEQVKEMYRSKSTGFSTDSLSQVTYEKRIKYNCTAYERESAPETESTVFWAEPLNSYMGFQFDGAVISEQHFQIAEDGTLKSYTDQERFNVYSGKTTSPINYHFRKLSGSANVIIGASYRYPWGDPAYIYRVYYCLLN